MDIIIPLNINNTVYINISKFPNKCQKKIQIISKRFLKIDIPFASKVIKVSKYLRLFFIKENECL